MRRLWESGLECRQFFRGSEDFSLIVGCTRRQKGDVEGDAGKVLMVPFQKVVRNHGPVTVKNPFLIVDLMSWRKVAGVYREDPVRVTKVFQTIIKTQDGLTRKQLVEYFNSWWLKYTLVIVIISG